MKKSKTAIAASHIVGIIQMVFGVVLTAFWGFGLIVFLFDFELTSFIICLVFVAIGVLLILKALQTKRLLSQFKKYVAVISTDPTGSIENLASALDISQKVVTHDMELMMKRKYFVNAHIDREVNSVVIEVRQSEVRVMNEGGTPQSTAPEQVTVTCKNCGGVSQIISGQVCECDFCGSPININN